MADKFELRRINRNRIYCYLHRVAEASTLEISDATGLSLPTVAKNLDELISESLVSAYGEQESTGGRKARIFRCKYDAKYAVGIDITEHHLTIVVVNLKGEIIAGGQRLLFVYSNSNSYYDSVVEKVYNLLDQCGIDHNKIIGIGVSLPAIVNRDSNLVTYSKIIGTPNDIVEAFRCRFPFAVELFNDAKSAGFAETWRSGFSKVFYLMLSNSVGGAIIENGDLLLGDNYRNAEIGHVRIVPNGSICYCGQKGCVNAYCSSKLLSDLTEGKLASFFEKVASGDEEMCAALDKYLHYLSLTIVNLRMLLDIPIILGGYAGEFLVPHMDTIRDLVTELNPYETDSSFILPCSYKKAASAVGDAMYFIDSFISNI